VAARRTGRAPDRLEPNVAPPAACPSAVLIAVGVILPRGGQCLRVRPAHHERRPPYSLMRTARGEQVPFTLRAGPEPRQTRRETFLRDNAPHRARPPGGVEVRTNRGDRGDRGRCGVVSEWAGWLGCWHSAR
jgi:hypothetical protein